MADFTHFNEQGRAKMVDITEKASTVRTAEARSKVTMNKETYNKIQNREIGKGDVLAVAQVAGIMAAKQTSSIIPMCHPIPIHGVDISFDWENTGDSSSLLIKVEARTKGGTGIEMEALTSASVCALTVYDMCKAADKGMIIGPTYLQKKTGGKSGEYRRNEGIEE